MLKHVADQIGAAPEAFSLYARREETRRDHTARLMMYLDTRSATLQDRRAALLSAIRAAATSDDGAAIVSSIVVAFRARGALLPAIDTIERIGLAGRAIARRWAETTLIKDIPLDQGRRARDPPSADGRRRSSLRARLKTVALGGQPAVRAARKFRGGARTLRPLLLPDLWVVTMAGSAAPKSSRRKDRTNVASERLFDRELEDLPADMRWRE
jgi:hypothetical protein